MPDLSEFTEPWLLKYVPENGRAAIDVGANTGAWSMMLAGRFREVYAFEPSLSIAQELITKAPRNLFVQNHAIWDGDSRMMEFAVYENPEHSGIKRRPWWGSNSRLLHTEEVASCSIDDFDYEEVDFIKIDVEGGEVHVVNGALETIGRDKPTLIIEIHATENHAAIAGMLPDYAIEIVRNPFRDEKWEHWNDHFWIICTPVN